jgi:hypothetical protein
MSSDFNKDRGKLTFCLRVYQVDVPKLEISVMQTEDMKITFLEERKGNYFFSTEVICELIVPTLTLKYGIAFYYNHSYAFASVLCFILYIQFLTT